MQSVQLNVTVLLSKADGLIQLSHATCSQMSNLMNQARLKVLKARDDLIAVSISQVNTQSLFLPSVRKLNHSLKKIWFLMEWHFLQHTKVAFQAALKRPWGFSPALLIFLFSQFALPAVLGKYVGLPGALQAVLRLVSLESRNFLLHSW